MHKRNMKKEWTRVGYWAQLLLLPFYGFSFLFPRDRKIWLFGSTFGRRFADNPKYFYLYLKEHSEENVRPIWISHKKEIVMFLQEHGCESYYYKSIIGIWYGLRAKVYLFDNYSKDINFWTSGGAIKINLWHGTGNKKANQDNVLDYFRHPRTWREWFLTFPRRLSDEKPNHYILATSKPLAIITESAFGTDSQHVLIDGYPRNDAMLDREFPNLYNEQEKNNLRQLQRWKEQGYVIDFYMPTFRDSEEKFFKVMDLEIFNEFLVQHRIIFISKLHPKSKLKEKFSKVQYTNIKNVDADVDPYTFLSYVDILTADYSSVYSDFMLLDRPVVAFHYDYEEYSTFTREGYVPFQEYMPEKTAYTMQELMKYTHAVLQADECREKRAVSRNRMFARQDAKATERLTGKIKRIIGGAYES